MRKADLQSLLKRCEDEGRGRLESKIRDCDEEVLRYTQRLENITAGIREGEGDKTF